MFNKAFTSALREMRMVLTSRSALVAMLGAGLVLGLSGPFDTGDVLSLPQALIYWVFVAVSSFALGSGVNAAVTVLIPMRWPRTARLALASLAIGGATFLLISTLNAIIFSTPLVPDALFTTLLVFVAISGVIVVGLDLAAGDVVPDDETPLVKDTPPPLLDRLRFEARGALVWLSVEDHYVQIVTSNGREMVLMRLSDAIREVGDTKGLQVHRSHWVGLDHVVAVKRQGDRALITLNTGDQVPVSRSYIAQIRAAGLLPKSG